jgi:hypothetical protein
MKKNISIKLAVLIMGTVSSYAMAKPMLATCAENCTLLCKIVGLC